MAKKWYSMTDLHANAAEISIFDEIGFFGVSAAAFIEDFKAIRDKEHINLYINSPGGEAADGLAIYNLLASVREKLSVEVCGIAASIASIIALAGSELIMDEGTFFVIHNPWAVSAGDAEQHRKDADILDKIKNEILNIYESHSNISRDELDRMLNEETWMNADEAVQRGFATSVNRELKAVALIDRKLEGFNKVPKCLVREQVSFKDKSIREVEDALRDVGLSRSEAKEVAAKITKSSAEETGAEVVEERDAPRQNDSIEFLNYLKSII